MCAVATDIVTDNSPFVRALGHGRLHPA